MNQYQDGVASYCEKIANHEFLGRDGEVALAKRIEDRETEVWLRLLTFGPALPLVLDTLESEGIVLPGFEALRRASSVDGPRPSKSSQETVSKQAQAVAAAIRDRDRDRVHLAAALAAIDAQAPIGPGHTKWRQGVAEANGAGAAARQRFVSANLRFVISMCRKFESHGISRDDLIQEGNIGLIKAVNRFDHRQGYRFSTYAGWWIRHAIQRSIANASRTVRVPVHFQDAYRQTLQAQRELSATLGREATIEEIAERCDTTVERVQAIRSRALGPAVSLDEPLGEDGTARVDLLTDPENDNRSPLDDMLRKQDVARVHELLGTLTQRQADVLRKRFGLGGFSPMSLRSIGEEYGLSRERVRQIQGIGLRLLRTTLDKQS